MSNNPNNRASGTVNVPGALHSTAKDGIVVFAGDIYDDNLQENQLELNKLFKESGGNKVLLFDEVVEEFDKSFNNSTSILYQNLSLEANTLYAVTSEVRCSKSVGFSIMVNYTTEFTDDKTAPKTVYLYVKYPANLTIRYSPSENSTGRIITTFRKVGVFDSLKDLANDHYCTQLIYDASTWVSPSSDTTGTTTIQQRRNITKGDCISFDIDVETSDESKKDIKEIIIGFNDAEGHQIMSSTFIQGDIIVAPISMYDCSITRTINFHTRGERHVFMKMYKLSKNEAIGVLATKLNDIEQRIKALENN